jgi:hypothetical protein
MPRVKYCGSIEIFRINDEYYRLRVDSEELGYFARFDQLEAQGLTLSDAIMGLHEQVEEIQ